MPSLSYSALMDDHDPLLLQAEVGRVLGAKRQAVVSNLDRRGQFPPADIGPPDTLSARLWRLSTVMRWVRSPTNYERFPEAENNAEELLGKLQPSR